MTVLRYVALITVIFILGCNSQGRVDLESIQNYYSVNPLASLTFVSNDAVNHTKTVGSIGESRGDYGYAEGNSSLRGHYVYDAAAGKLTFERSLASSNAWADHIFIPGDNPSTLRHKLNEILMVSVKIKAQFNVDHPTLATACGIVFAFGDNVGHPNAANLGASLRLGGRNWALATNPTKTPRDYFRIGYETQKNAQKLTIDAPINSYNAAATWSRFTASQWREIAGEFSVMRNTSLTTAGDYIVYRQDMAFDIENGLVTVTITPLESNLDMSQWVSQSVEWDISQPVTNTSTGGSARGGLDLTNVTGPSAMTLAELGELEVSLGFVGNQAPRVCEFSELEVRKPL